MTALPTTDMEFAKSAFALMEKYGIVPIPEHYAVWFHYAAGRNAELVGEIENILKNGLAFTPETNAYLYHKYVASQEGQRALADATAGSQKVLVDVLKVINDFSGETQTYHKNIDEYLQDISQNVADANVKQIVRQLVEKTTSLKHSGEKLHLKLVESTKEITDLRKNLQQVITESQRDFLTGVFNRKTFEHLFDEQLAAIKETPTDMCLVMLDIDHFKKFNDRYGHLIGDEVLKTVGRILTDILKGRDIVARFGGEEFILMLPDTPLEGALKVCDTIRCSIAAKELKRKDTGDRFGSITVSMGVARYRPESDTLPLLIKRADDALYQAKRTGRNRVSKEV